MNVYGGRQVVRFEIEVENLRRENDGVGEAVKLLGYIKILIWKMVEA